MKTQGNNTAAGTSNTPSDGDKPAHVSKLRRKLETGGDEDRTPTVKVGDDIVFVGHNGTHYPAEVTAANKDGTVDLDALVNGEVITITKSPEDVTAKRVDSWHVPVTEAAKEPAKK